MMNIYTLLGVWLLLWIGGWWIAKKQLKTKQPIGAGWLISLPFLIVWMLIAGYFQTEQTLPVEPVSAAVVEPVKKEPTPATTPTIHTDPKMALTYAKQRLADLKADYARNAALYQNKDTQGLRDIRGELIDAMNTNKSDSSSEMRFFMGCDEAYQQVVFLNAYYGNEADLQDGHDLETIAKHETDYEYWLGLCEENIQSSTDILNEQNT